MMQVPRTSEKRSGRSTSVTRQFPTWGKIALPCQPAPSVPAARLVRSLRSAPLTPGCANSRESDVAAGAQDQ
jgi:hypothetical protein